MNIKAINFTSNAKLEQMVKANAALTTRMPQVSNDTVYEDKKVPLYTNLRNKFLGLVKGYNTTTGLAGGVVKGAIEAALFSTAVGVVGKSVKDADANFFKTFANVGVELVKGTTKALKAVPSLITKSPVENIKSFVKTPVNFAKGHFKGNKVATLIATAGSVGLLAFNVVKGKLKANNKNAGVDHYTQTGHNQK